MEFSREIKVLKRTQAGIKLYLKSSITQLKNSGKASSRSFEDNVGYLITLAINRKKINKENERNIPELLVTLKSSNFQIIVIEESIEQIYKFVNKNL